MLVKEIFITLYWNMTSKFRRWH